MEDAQDCDGYDAGEGVSDQVIEKAEELLGISFSRQMREYLSDYAYIEFFGVEIYGIIEEDFSSTCLEGNIVEWALSERKKNGLDSKWVPVRFEDDGIMVFQDYNELNEEGEPAIIVASLTEDGYEYVEQIADDLGDYIAELVDMQLEDQE